MRRFWALGTAVLLVVAACGGGGDGDLDEDDQAIADAIFDQIMAEAEPGDPFGETEARCFADGVVGEFGSAELISLGLSVAEIEAGAEPSDVDLSEDQVGKMVDVMTDCVDFRAAFTEEFRNEGISDESADCLADGSIAVSPTPAGRRR